MGHDERSRGCFTINKDLVPLKCVLFFFTASAYAILPYLTIHMKDIGISDIDVALIYTILPFCVFVAPPLVGFLADKLGNFTRVLMVNVVLCGLFHTLLLVVPHTVRKVDYPPTAAIIKSHQVSLDWRPSCPLSNTSHCSPTSPPPSSVTLSLINCHLSCSVNSDMSVEEHLCSLLPRAQCRPNPVKKTVSIKGLLPNITETGCGSAVLDLYTRQDPCETQSGVQWEMMSLSSDCQANCTAVTDIVRQCGVSDNGNRETTIGIYFILRVLATISLALVFILTDAQTIQMCKLEEEAGNKGAYGRQVLYKTLAQAIISPLVGLLMDKISSITGSTNYVAPFVISDILLLCTLVCLCVLKGDIGLPKGGDTMKGVKSICMNINIIIFLVMMFVCGANFGFVETFLFVFLKEDLNAPIYLLGLTITTGALVSIPFLYYSDVIVKKIGTVNVIILALFGYGVRYLGYSYITCAWYAFPFEALEVLTLYLLSVGGAMYVKDNSPPGTLATLSGMSGGAHFGFGKGVGALLGGLLKDQFGLSFAFRTFGMCAFAFGVVYALFYVLYGRKSDQRQEDKKLEQMEREKLEPFLSKGEIIKK